jgi:hypothetical protein
MVIKLAELDGLGDASRIGWNYAAPPFATGPDFRDDRHELRTTSTWITHALP